jgi:iron complex transport system ATP-binding protein
MSEAMIQTEGLSIQLSGQSVLQDVSLSVNRGEYVSIIGPNGAGKTTLIKCMAGIYRHWCGMVRIDGKSFACHRPKELAKVQSYVPQAEGRFIPLTVEQFVATGRYPHLSAFTTLRAEDHRAIEDALQQADLISFRHRTMNTISGGERQMAFIAAALAQEASILLLDEPSTFLDYRHQGNVSSLLKKACRESGITVVAVHHDINTATACSDRIYALKQGSIAVEGTPSEIADAEVLYSIYGTEFHTIGSSHRPLPFIATGGTM